MTSSRSLYGQLKLKKLKTRHFLLTLLFLGSLFSFLYINYDAKLNKEVVEIEQRADQLILEEEGTNTSIMPDVDILYKVGTVVKRLLPISK